MIRRLHLGKPDVSFPHPKVRKARALRAHVDASPLGINDADTNFMSYSRTTRTLSIALVAGGLMFPAFADDKKDSSNKEGQKPSEADMMAMMMQLAKPGENHKILQEGVGTWSYTVKFWMSPDGPPNESTGTTVGHAIMDGRYVVSDHSGKMQMPGENGKMMEMDFKGMAVEGYDNVKKKFVSTWIDNMGTGILFSEGTYEPATKTLTYLGEYEQMPGMKVKARQVVKAVDKDHRTMQYFEDRGGKEVKSMEITYVRKS